MTNLSISIHDAYLYKTPWWKSFKTIVRKLGIVFRGCYYDSIEEKWVFCNCECIPEDLPPYIHYEV